MSAATHTVGLCTAGAALVTRAGSLLVAAATMTWAVSASAADVTYADGDFAPGAWLVTTVVIGNGGSQSMVSNPSGGNPGGYGRITNSVASAPSPTTFSAIHGFCFRPDFVINPALVGGIDSIDATEDAIMFEGFGAGQGRAVAARQSGSTYLAAGTGSNFGGWTSVVSPALTAASFGRFDPATGAVDVLVHPDFSAAGGLIELGFYRGNSTCSGCAGYSIIGGIDNWAVTVHLPTKCCPGDITGDGIVNIDDLLAVINAWGRCPARPAECPADVNQSGAVNIDDLLLVINNWS